MVGKLAACHADFLERPLQRGTLCAQCSLSLTYLTWSCLIFSTLCSSPFWFPPATTPGDRCWDQVPSGWQVWGAGKKGWTYCSLPARWRAFSLDTVDRAPEGPAVLAWEHCPYQAPPLVPLCQPPEAQAVVCTLFRRICSGCTSPPSLIPHYCLDFLENPFARTIKGRIVDSPREVSILCVRVLPSL